MGFACDEINKNFQPDEEKWNSRRAYGIYYRVAVKKVGGEAGTLDAGWCKAKMTDIIPYCEVGGQVEEGGYKIR